MRDTIDMAREAGLGNVMRHNSIEGDRIWIEGADWHDEIKRFEALVRADERADCERVVGIALLGAEMDLAKRVLRAIRARGNT
jgi:hypothetical protein